METENLIKLKGDIMSPLAVKMRKEAIKQGISYHIFGNERLLYSFSDFDFMRNFAKNNEGAQLVLLYTTQAEGDKIIGTYDSEKPLNRQELMLKHEEDFFGAYNKDEKDDLKDMFADKIAEAIHEEYFEDAKLYLNDLANAVQMLDDMDDGKFLFIYPNGEAQVEGEIYGNSFYDPWKKLWYIILLEIQ